MNYKLSDVAEYISVKIQIDSITIENYISTENMLPDKGGVRTASSLPSTPKTNSFQTGDVLFSNIRTYFRKVWFATFEGGVSNDVLVLRTLDTNILYSEYLYYILSNEAFIQYTVTTAKGTKMPRGDKSAIMNYEFELPSLLTQKKIAHILSTLDDKIELNRKMNQTLEEMAQTLFKSWFVDFDPVHAKAECKSEQELETTATKLGISKEILDLFPNEFEESEMGMIPKGWGIQSIYDVANIVYGAPFSSKNFNDTQTGKPLIRIRDLKTFNSQHWTEEEHVKGTLIKAGNLLIGMDAEFTPTIWQGIDGWLNQRVLKIEPKNGTFTAFHYFAMKPKMKFFEQANVGTTVIHLGKKDIDTIEILMPSKEILKKAAAIMEPLFQQLVQNSISNRSLQKTRDTLLPKLLSGDIDVG